MRQFNSNKTIYQQISDQLRDMIISDTLQAGDRVPSVREMAVTMGVNPNTVSRSYQELTDAGIIENSRGVGFFVISDAREKIIKEMKEEFFLEHLPSLFLTMEKLGISKNELLAQYKKYTVN